MEQIKSLFNEMTATFAEFEANAASFIDKGNKAAGRRARKQTLALEKLFKQFRKMSVSVDSDSAE